MARIALPYLTRGEQALDVDQRCECLRTALAFFANNAASNILDEPSTPLLRSQVAELTFVEFEGLVGCLLQDELLHVVLVEEVGVLRFRVGFVWLEEEEVVGVLVGACCCFGRERSSGGCPAHEELQDIGGLNFVDQGH